MDKKYQKIATVLLSFLAVFLVVGLPLLVNAQTTSLTPSTAPVNNFAPVGAFGGETWYQVIFQWVIGGFGSLVAMIGWALDYSIQNFILEFGTKYQTSNLGHTIDSLWSMVRDIFNLTFIFGLIYIGFKMILDSSDSHARHTLVSLIGAALLVNFSLFITKFIVDFSDIAAYKVFEAFKSSTPGANASISLAFQNLLGMSSLFNNGALANAGATGSLLYLTGTLLVLLVLAYVYLAGAVLIAIRFVVLTIYLIFSPVMFIGWVFPSMHKRSEDYWHGFLGQAFFAPAFLFMLYISYRVVYEYNDNISKLVFQTGGGYFAQKTFSQADSLIPFFIMTITFLIASMIVAKNMGAVGAGSVIKVGKDLQKRGQVALGGATFGMAARAGRSTFGAGASAAANSEWMRSLSKTGRVGRSIYNATSGVADSSFDARKVGGMGKSFGIGEGKKGGFTTRVKEQKEADEKYLKDIGTRDADKYDPATKEAKAEWERLEDLADKEPNLVAKAEFARQAKAAKTNYEQIKEYYSAREEYKHQLAYTQSIENWQKKQRAVAMATGGIVGGIAAGILTGGIAPAALGLAAGVGGGAVIGTGNRYQNEQTSKALRKEYGTNGIKKRGEHKKKHAIEAALEAAGHGGAHGDKKHDKKPKKEEAEAHDEHEEEAHDEHDDHKDTGGHPPTVH